MGLLDSFSKMLSGGRLNVESRYDLLRTAVAGSMSSFHMALDKKTGDVVGLKLLDPEKTEHFESRFPGLKKPTEGEIAVQMDHPRIVKTLEHGT
ncbi:MAG: serine/threonine protein kinase, partial [Planctomycetales bacterium]|nr:serine/threonine protein kinase [Planctomycetales bacterium]